MAQTYKAWLKAKGLTSSKTNAQKWRAAQRRPPRPQAGQNRNTPPFSYAAQIARDPLSVPFDSDIVWQGRGRPNMQTLINRGGFENLTPVRRPDGGWAVFGQDEELMPDWAREQMQGITQRGQQVQQYAQGQVAPWLAQQLAALQNIQGQAQTNFANLIGQSGAAIANAAAQAGPGAAHASSAAMAPFQSQIGLANELSAGQAASNAGAAAYQGAVDTLQGGNLAQGLQASLAQEIARIPDQYEQQRLDFERQLSPLLMQLGMQRDEMEANRRMALLERSRWEREFGEGRRQFNENLKTERQIAGMNFDLAAAELDAETAAAQADAEDEAISENYRTLTQIRQSLGQNQRLLDNQGRGFNAPGPKKYHGKAVRWEQAKNGLWYGIVGGGGKGGSGGGTKNIWSDVGVREKLERGARAGWAGDPENHREGWRTMGRDDIADAEKRLGLSIMYPREFKVAQWVAAQAPFLSRGGNLATPQLRAWLDSVLPEVDSGTVVSYLAKITGRR